MSSTGLLLQVDEKVLYEHDFGSLDISFQPEPQNEDTETPNEKGVDINAMKPLADDSDEPTSFGKASRKIKYDEDDDADEERYSAAFGISFSGVYFDEKDMSLKVEYRLLREEGVHESAPVILNGQAGQASPREMVDASKDGQDMMNAAAGVYIGHPPMEKMAENLLGPEAAATYDAGVLNIEYKSVELINGQKTYQRVVLRAENDGESVYGLTMRKLSDAGMGASAEYDGEFGSMIFTSINGKEEGTDGNFNEFYLNGEIGKKAVNEQQLKKGDIIEWRYAEETDGSCGGSPDFNAIKSMMEYSTFAGMYAQQFGLQQGRPQFQQPGNGYGTLIFH